MDAQPKTSTPFDLRLDQPTTEPVTLTITSAAQPCTVSGFPYPQFAQVIDMVGHAAN